MFFKRKKKRRIELGSEDVAPYNFYAAEADMQIWVLEETLARREREREVLLEIYDLLQDHMKQDELGREVVSTACAMLRNYHLEETLRQIEFSKGLNSKGEQL